MKLTLLLSFLITAHLSASFVAQEAKVYLKEADLVIVVNITSGQTNSYQAEDHVGVCGYTYTGTVWEEENKLKGTINTKSIEFASANALKMQTRYLIALTKTDKDFSKDSFTFRSIADEKKDVSCRANLPELKEEWLFTSEFVDNQNWVYSGYNVLPPKGVEGFSYEVTEIDTGKEKKNPNKIKNNKVLPYSVKLPVTLLNWASYRDYLIEEIAKIEANKSLNQDATSLATVN